jgi:Tol biopolymer transport system component
MPARERGEERLDSWKEIASYLGRDVTTVQRWERREAMPVHRHLHRKLGSVHAFRGELDAWAQGRNLPPPAPSTTATAPRAVAPVRPPVAAAPWGRLLLAGAVVLLAAITGIAWLAARSEYFWTSPLAGARVRRVTSFEGTERAAAISPDGTFVAFLSDRDGATDVWMTQLGSGGFHNLTGGRLGSLATNPSVRMLGFSPDGVLVTFWVRRSAATPSDIATWAVPALGGEPKPYLEAVAEFDWSADGERLVYHTAAEGDPMFVRERGQTLGSRPIFAAPAGAHAHYPSWSPDRSFIYFVQGTVPDAMDVWRIRPSGGAPERVTHHDSRVSHPVLLDRRTLLYLATSADGSGPWLFSMDVNRRVAHRLSSPTERYTSLAASDDGRRVIATLASPRESVWRLPISPDAQPGSRADTRPVRVPLPTGSGSSPRLGAGLLLYTAASDDGDALWRLAGGAATELWSQPGARIAGGPAIAPDGRMAFAARVDGKTRLHVMGGDGTGTRVLAGSLEVRGAPTWAPDGRSIVVAADDRGVPRLFAVPLDGRPPARLAPDYAVDPAFAPGGSFVVYSGPDVGTTLAVKAVTPDGRPHPLRDLSLTRGARHLRFLPGRSALVVLRGDIEHKDLWLVDLDTGAERQLTRLPADFDVDDFDLAPDGREAVLHRVQEQSDVVLFDLTAR